MDDAAQAEIAATITQRLYGEFALKETIGSSQCSKLTNTFRIFYSLLFLILNKPRIDLNGTRGSVDKLPYSCVAVAECPWRNSWCKAGRRCEFSSNVQLHGTQKKLIYQYWVHSPDEHPNIRAIKHSFFIFRS